MKRRSWAALGLVPWVVSLLAHGSLASLLMLMPQGSILEKSMQPIEVVERELPPPLPKPRPPEPKPEPKPEVPPPPPPAPPKIKPRPRPRPAEPPPEPPPAEVKADEPQEATGPKIFGINLEGTTTAGKGEGVAVPQGDSLAVSPRIRKRGPKQKSKGPKTGFKTTYRRNEAAPIAMITTKPKVKKRVLASFPERARDLGIEGRVVLELTINADGKVIKAELLKGLHPLLDASAEKAAFKMWFVPATVNGTPVKVKIKYTFTFVLD